MNILILTYNYSKLSTPSLNEEQRIENVDNIMSRTISLFAASAIIIGMILFFVARKKYKKTRLLTINWAKSFGKTRTELSIQKNVSGDGMIMGEVPEMRIKSFTVA